MVSLVAESMSSTHNSSAAQGRLVNPSVPQFLHLHYRNAVEAHITQSVQVSWGFSENTHANHLVNIHEFYLSYHHSEEFLGKRKQLKSCDIVRLTLHDLRWTCKVWLGRKEVGGRSFCRTSENLTLPWMRQGSLQGFENKTSLPSLGLKWSLHL